MGIGRFLRSTNLFVVDGDDGKKRFEKIAKQIVCFITLSHTYIESDILKLFYPFKSIHL